MKKKSSLFFLLFLCAVLSVHAQSLVVGTVQDAFLKTPLPQAKVSLLLAADSTVVTDSVPLRVNKREDGTIRSAEFWLQMEKKTCKYLLRASLEGYEDAWMPLSIDAGNDGVWMMDDPLQLRKMREQAMKEVVVTATRVKMYHKGDTLVYDATAFKLPDGSMLDDLIRQMPGVILNDDGEIFVNGRKVDELLLGARSFMRGNKKVLLENLPYFTVKNIKVYDKQSDISEALGFDVGERRYVMDVNLKQEYSVGCIANVEAAGGTQQRWLGRGFLLGFTNRWRYSVMANANNVNETRHISGDGHWSPASMPQSLLTTRSVATNLNYQRPDRKLKNDFTADFTSTDTESEMRQRYEQFLDGREPVSTTNNIGHTDNWRVKCSNGFTLLKPLFLVSNTDFDYEKRSGWGQNRFRQWDDSLTASRYTDALSEGCGWRVNEHVQGAYGKENKYYTNFSLHLWHRESQSRQSERYNTWQTSEQNSDIRHNANDISGKHTGFSLNNLWRFSKLVGKADLTIRENLNYYNDREHDYLYHPDTLVLASQLDLLTAITDPANSYDMNLTRWQNTLSLYFMQWASSGAISYEKWSAGLELPVYHNSMDYQRDAIDTLMNDTKTYLLPFAKYRYVAPKNRHDFSVKVQYQSAPVWLPQQVPFRDDSQPLVVKEGNPNLKGTARTSAEADYTLRFGKRSGQLHAGATFNYNHRDVAQSVTYAPETGVYTYMPMNISGAYNLTIKLDLSSPIDEKQRWSWQMNADGSYNHLLDHTMLAGETESHVSTVNTLILHERAYVQYHKDAFNIRATGDISWRHSEGRMRDFAILNAFDYRYGLSARYTIPRIKTTLSADGNMYSRRGYGSRELNTDDFVLNASISQPFLKGRLVAHVEAFDLLHQVSSTQYVVTAQGRTETWHRSLPHYIMGHLVFHFNKNPKKK